MRKTAVSPTSALPKLVDAFAAFEAAPEAAGSVWKLAEAVNRAVLPLGPALRHFAAAEGAYVAFTSCKRKHALIGHDGAHWVYREGSGRPRKGDLEDALTFLTSALECAVAGEVKDPADAFFADLYKYGEPTAEPGELVLDHNVLLNMEQISASEVYLGYIYVPPEARGTGAGSKVLQLVADLADTHCVTVALKARSFRITDPYSRELDKSEGPNLVATEALVKLYQRFGFKGSARYMERLPTCAVETTQKAARFLAIGSWQDLLDQSDGFVYHVTCGPWDGGVLESLQDRIPDYEERLEFIREKWPESDSNYTPEEYDFSEADTIHCNWTLEEAEEWRDIYCPDGQILEIAWHWCDLRVERGREQDGHPVIRGRIPAKCIEVIA